MFSAWLGMHARCTNPNYYRFDRYGGRGIVVCERWNDFDAFYRDMGKRPKGHSLDRVNNDGNYEPSNCRWATPKEQASNRSCCINITAFGRTQCVSQWEKETGTDRRTILKRLAKGLSAEIAITFKGKIVNAEKIILRASEGPERLLSKMEME